MIRLAFILTVLAAPAFAGGPVWEDMIAETAAGPQILGAVLACADAVTSPQSVASVLAKAGWEHGSEDDGTDTYTGKNASLMFWSTPGFCMIDTSVFNTDGMTRFLAGFDIVPMGKDADGCAQFDLPDAGVVATLTGGGNDPVCTSATESTLRFEPAS